LNGLLLPIKGSVENRSQEDRRYEHIEISRKIGFLFQNPDSQLFLRESLEEVSFGLRNLGLEGKVLEDRTKKYLQLLGLEKFADSPR